MYSYPLLSTCFRISSSVLIGALSMIKLCPLSPSCLAIHSIHCTTQKIKVKTSYFSRVTALAVSFLFLAAVFFFFLEAFGSSCINIYNTMRRHM
ncbi:hypothetical protein BD770DRAFT_390384 [Pilaira anomala]|nr:hypothetical protein BD770DRAFT_390384 [Pilaira anomala]